MDTYRFPLSCRERGKREGSPEDGMRVRDAKFDAMPNFYFPHPGPLPKGEGEYVR